MRGKWFARGESLPASQTCILKSLLFVVVCSRTVARCEISDFCCLPLLPLFGSSGFFLLLLLFGLVLFCDLVNCAFVWPGRISLMRKWVFMSRKAHLARYFYNFVAFWKSVYGRELALTQCGKFRDWLIIRQTPKCINCAVIVSSSPSLALWVSIGTKNERKIINNYRKIDWFSHSHS